MGRLRYNGLSTTLGAALTASATSVTFSAALTHSGGTAVPTVASPDYIPFTIFDASGNVSEIVYLTAYTSGATTGTITRAQEGTTGVAHSSGDRAAHGPSVADFAAVMPDDIPTPPSAYDYEFNGTSSTLPSGWSWVNQGTSTYAEGSGGGALNIAAGGSDEWRGIARSLPATPFTATVKMTMLTKTGSSLYPSRGLMLRDSSTGKMVLFHAIQNPKDDATSPNQVNVVVDCYSNLTTYSSRPVATVTLAGGTQVNYFKMRRNSATSTDFLLSQDGIAWLTIGAAVDLSTLLTPNQIGVAVNQRTLTPAVGVHWFRVS